MRSPETLSLDVPPNGDPTLVAPPGIRRKNRSSIDNSLLTQHCLTRGCRERIADLEIITLATPPAARLAIHSPWVNESRTEEDAKRWTQAGLGGPENAPGRRIRLTGGFDPEVSPLYIKIDLWQPGNQVHIICRLGHDNALTPAVLQSAARRASVRT